MLEAVWACFDLLLLWAWSRSAVFWMLAPVIALGALAIIGNLFEPASP